MWHRILRVVYLSVGIALLVLFPGASVSAQTISFRKVADTNTPVPGGTGTFTGFITTTAVIDRGNVAFTASAASPRVGVYTDIGGTLRQVATSNTVGPDGIRTFVSVYGPSIDNGLVAFLGDLKFNNGTRRFPGVFLEASGTITVVAETGDPAPNGGVFSFFGVDSTPRPSLDAGNVAFAAGTSVVGSGVFLNRGGTLSVVADANTVRPGGTETFLRLSHASLSGDNVAFGGFALSGVKGVYARVGGVLQVVADNTMAAPGGTTTFFGPVGPAIDGTDIIFADLGSSPQSNDAQEGSYTYYDGVLNAGILGAPLAPGSPSLENRIIVFNRGPGIITTNMGGSEFRVIGSGDILDGKSLSIAYQSREALSGNEIVFFAFFDDQSQGIYVAQIQMICGNQIVEPGEECDDGGGSASCDFDCTFPMCGDGVLNTFTGEVCDNGVNNSDTVADACRLDCTLARCGDGVIDTGEACDDAGPSATCLADCTLSVCGDGVVNSLAGEVCDDAGQSIACDTDCTFAECGDATTNALAGEQCDEGMNNSDTRPNACRLNCLSARCGDGVVDSSEVCDDGNTVNGDFCPSDCQADGFVIPAVSDWGLVILALLLCVGARLQFGFRMAK